MDNKRTSLQDPSRAVRSYNLLINYIRKQRTLLRTNINDSQYQQNIDQAVTHFTEVLTFTIDPNAYSNNPEEQATPTTPNNPITSLQFSSNKMVQFMHSLCRIDISNLTKDNKDCEICFQRFGELRWGNDHLVNAGVLEPFKVLEDMMPEDPVKLPCGHYLDKLCLRTWIKKTREEQPTCPKCRANLRNVKEDNGPST